MKNKISLDREEQQQKSGTSLTTVAELYARHRFIYLSAENILWAIDVDLIVNGSSIENVECVMWFEIGSKYISFSQHTHTHSDNART